MPWESLSKRIGSLPLVLAGPILRRTDEDFVTVWIALKQKRKVTLIVTDLAGRVRLVGEADTTELGVNLHVVAVTANWTQVENSSPLEAGNLFFYDLEFSDGTNLSGQVTGVSYESLSLPTFTIPPANLSDLRLLHGSCRKPHGEGLDAMESIDRIIESCALDIGIRPQQLFLTGDQVYVDDVADTLLFMLMDAAQVLLGWNEDLGLPSDELKPGGRADVAKNKAGLNASPVYTRSHLFRFGEFCAMHLFVWSDVLWPIDLPAYNDVYPMPKIPSAKSSNEHKDEVDRLNVFRDGLTAVRRALANIPVYMTPDDHEVTDDWNFNKSWCEAVYVTPLGLTLVQNALAAFAVFQAWGNTPDLFSGAEPGAKLLTAIETWSKAKQKNDTTQDLPQRTIIGNCVGVPSDFASTIKSTSKVVPGNNALRWDYHLIYKRYEVIGLDTRCFRSFDTSPYPILLGADGFKKQLRERIVPKDTELTIVISAVPIVFAEFIENLQTSEKDPTTRDAEGWGLRLGALAEVYAALAERGQVTGSSRFSRVLVLSGDVHASFTAQLQFRAAFPFNSPKDKDSKVKDYQMDLAQFTASAFLNEDTETRQLHQIGFASVIEGHEHHGWKSLSVKDVGDQVVPTRQNLFSPPIDVSGPIPIFGKAPVVAKLSPSAKTASLTVSPDWSYKATLRGDYNVIDKIPAPPKTEVKPPDPGDRRDALKQYLSMSSNHTEYTTRRFGRDVVGTSCLGEITVSWPSGSGKSVTHSLWWRLGLPGGGMLSAFPLTTCTVEFDLIPNPFKASRP